MQVLQAVEANLHIILPTVMAGIGLLFFYLEYKSTDQGAEAYSKGHYSDTKNYGERFRDYIDVWREFFVSPDKILLKLRGDMLDFLDTEFKIGKRSKNRTLSKDQDAVQEYSSFVRDEKLREFLRDPLSLI